MAITYHAGRRLQGLSTDVNPTYETDFSSSTGWTQVGSTTSIGSGIASLLPTSGNNDRVYTPISFNTNGKFVIDYDFIINSESKSDSSSMGIVGTSNSSDGSLTDDAIVWGIQFAGSSPTVSLFGKNFSGGSEDSTANGTIQLSTSTTYYARIIRDGTSNIMYLYTSSANRDSGTSADSVSITMTSAVTNDMTQLVLGGRTTGSGSCDTDLDNISLYSGVIVANSGKPANVQVGSRFEETDTRKMYHKLDVTGADLSLSELKAYWKFNESSGDIVNQAISVGSTDGLGTTASNLQIAGADYDQTGITSNNKSLYFDGSDHGQSGTSASQFNFLHTPNTKWTINFWLKYGGDTTVNTILDTNGGGGTARVGLLIDVLTDEGLEVWMGRGVALTTVIAKSTSANFVPSDSAFHFYSIRYDHTLASSNVKISIDNGTPVTGNKTSDTPSSADSAFPFNIAENCNGYGAFLDGNLTEMSIWNRVLTDAEVTTIYNSGSGKRIGDSWKEEGT